MMSALVLVRWRCLLLCLEALFGHGMLKDLLLTCLLRAGVCKSTIQVFFIVFI